MQLNFETYTPSEVAKITGVSTDNQRNLRRAGYLPKTIGHARFNLQEIARLLVIGLMSEKGIGPKVSTAFAETAARGIFLKSLWNSEVYSQDAVNIAHEETHSEFVESIEKLKGHPDLNLDADAKKSLHGSIAKDHLVTKVEAMSGAQGEKAPEFFCYWANDYPEFFYGDNHPFEDHAYGIAAWQGPVVMLSMGSLAAVISAKLPRPAIYLEGQKEQKK